MKHPKIWFEAALAVITLLIVVFTVTACIPSEPPAVLVLEPLPVSASPAVKEDVLLNINTASAEELDSLPGIGPVLAERMVAWREENGAFASPEDILSVSGIGEAKYEALQPYITY